MMGTAAMEDARAEREELLVAIGVPVKGSVQTEKWPGV